MKIKLSKTLYAFAAVLLASLLISTSAFSASAYSDIAIDTSESYTDGEEQSFEEPEVEAVNLNKTAITLGKGETYKLNTYVTPSSAPTILTWSSENKKIAKISNGTVTAVDKGTTTVSVKTSNGKTASCKVTIKSAPSSITLNKSAVTLGVGEEYSLSRALPSGSSSMTAWTTSDKSIATVSAGKITPVATGTATITAKTFNGKTASCKVTVKKAPYSIKISKSSVTLGLGESLTLTRTLPENTSSITTWTTSNKSIATVSKGVITAKAVGTASITAKTFNGKTAVCSITVKKIPSSLSLNKAACTLGVGESYTLSCTYSPNNSYGTTTWTTSNKSIAAVSNGKVTAKAVGTATITAKTFNGKTASCKITVKNAPSSISLNKTTATLGIGEAYTLTRTLPSGTSSVTTWESSNNNVITVSKGVLTPKSMGTATITAKTFNGKSAKCTVTVKNAPTSLSLNKSDLILGLGETFKLTKVLSANSSSVITWTTSNSSIVTVSGGTVTAKKAGTATITAKTYNGLKAVCKITVKAAPSSVTLSKTSIELGKGETYALTCSLPANTASYGTKITSSNNSVATIADGILTAKGNGTATITAKTFNGKTATCKVTVKPLATSVSLNATSLTLMLGETYDLDSTVPDGTAGIRTFKTADKTIATVNGKGIVTGVKTGKTVITVSLSNGVKATCDVNVIAEKKSVAKTTTRATTLRQEPMWSSKSLATVNAKSTVYQYSTTSDGRWIKVKYGTSYGWLYNKAFGVSKNYKVIDTTTLPVVADDILFDKGTSISALFNYAYNLGYRNMANSSIENLCVYAFNYGRGACYHHAAVLYYLLDRAGYEVIDITDGIDKYTGGGPHSWVMIKTADGWRHLDPTGIIGLTTGSYKFYLVKDSAIDPYFTWNRTKYPPAI